MALAAEAARGLGLEPQFTIIGMRDGEIPAYVATEDTDVFVVDRRSLLDPGGCWRVLGEQDLVLDIGAGDSFADLYGAKRFFFLWATKAMAIAGRTPLVLSPQTIGPFTRPPYPWLARQVMERADAVVARDDVSEAAVKTLAPRARRVLAVDVAFALPYADRSAERGGARTRVGVNVSGLLFSEAEAGTNRFGLTYDYARVMRRWIARLVEREDVDVHLISHVTSRTIPHDDDERVADRLAAEFSRAIRTPRFDGPSEAKSHISSLDFLAAARMHASIAALSSGVPVAPMAYSRKFSGLFGMLGYPWVVPTQGMDEDGVLARLDESLDGRARLANDAAQAMRKVDGLLSAYRYELARVMTAASEPAR
jgi:polysaccharide pyruvyl transferase WcaK-like protein